MFEESFLPFLGLVNIFCLEKRIRHGFLAVFAAYVVFGVDNEVFRSICMFFYSGFWVLFLAR